MLKDFFKRNYLPLNTIEISKQSLINNYHYLSSLDSAITIAPVLKSNAYGHGISLIANLVDNLTPPFICVDSLFEAYKLWKNKVKTKILVMGYVSPKSLQTKKLPFAFAVFNKETIDVLHKYQPQAAIHVFVDTGMHREGVTIEQLPELLQYITQQTKLNIEGLMSHFALAEKHDNPLTQQQIETFAKAQKVVTEMDIHPKWIHIANSGGMLNHKHYKGKLGNVARVGKAFYGYDPENLNGKLKPALTLQTHIAQIKQIKKGEHVGYDFTFVAKHSMTIAILPIGYNDGVERGLSNTGVVSIKNLECPIIGRVSMNITTIDVSHIKNLKLLDEVIVYTNDLTKKNAIDNAGKLANTITHEMLVHLSPSIKRILV